MFGHEDRFLNATAYWGRRLGYFPIIDQGSTLIQPVYAADIGKAIMAMIRVIFFTSILGYLAYFVA